MEGRGGQTRRGQGSREGGKQGGMEGLEGQTRRGQGSREGGKQRFANGFNAFYAFIYRSNFHNFVLLYSCVTAFHVYAAMSISDVTCCVSLSHASSHLI